MTRIKAIKIASLVGALMTGAALIASGQTEQGFGVIFAAFSSANLAQ